MRTRLVSWIIGFAAVLACSYILLAQTPAGSGAAKPQTAKATPNAAPGKTAFARANQVGFARRLDSSGQRSSYSVVQSSVMCGSMTILRGGISVKKWNEVSGPAATTVLRKVFRPAPPPV